MQLKRIALMAAPALLIALVVAAVTLAAPSSSDAQESPATTEAPAEDNATETPSRDKPFRFNRATRGHHTGLNAAAEAIGISLDELGEALRSGQTIAEVAVANGVAESAVIEAIVADHNERIDEALAAERITAERAEQLKDTAAVRAEQMVNGELTRPAPGFKGPRFGPRCDGGAGLAAAAEVIGIEVEALVDELRAGQTVAAVAAANGVAVDNVIDAIVAVHEARIDEALADGTLDEDKTAELRATARERAEAMVNGERPDRGEFRRGHGRRGVGPGRLEGRGPGRGGFGSGFGNQTPGFGVTTATETINA